MISARIDRLHRCLARNRYAAEACRRIRNQVDCVIGAYLGETSRSHANGEFKLLEHVAPACWFFVDVGANVGEWSARFLELSSACGIAYEPSPKTFLALTSRLAGKRLSLIHI